MPTPRSVELRRHPGERRPRREVILAQVGGGCCCCCCCCCLQSVGGLIGGILGTNSRLDKVSEPAEAPVETAPSYAGESVMCRVYWWLLLAVFVGAVFVAYNTWGHSFGYLPGSMVPAGILAGLAVVGVLLPVVQLVVSGLALFFLPLIAADQRNAALRRLGRITLWSVFGTLIGVGVMLPVAGLVLLSCR
jgi:hypothetical protein